jgi:Ras-related protein Rab-1A
MTTSEYDFVFKILLIGNSAVGKSSLLMRFADDIFHETFLPTIGVDFKIRTIEHEGSKIKLQMWDTAGQEKFKTITAAYYKGAQGIVLVFDLCDKKSFADIKTWLSEVNRLSTDESVKILVGNKSDLINDRQVSKEEAERFAENEGMIYYEASAKNNSKVDTIFRHLSDAMKEKFSKQYIQKYKKTTTYLTSLKPEARIAHRKTCC